MLHFFEKFINTVIGKPENGRIDLWYAKLWSFMNDMNFI